MWGVMFLLLLSRFSLATFLILYVRVWVSFRLSNLEFVEILGCEFVHQVWEVFTFYLLEYFSVIFSPYTLSHYVGVVDGLPHFSEALFIFLHLFILVFFRLHNFPSSLYKFALTFLFQLKWTAESLKWMFSFSDCAIQLQIFHSFVIFVSSLLFCMWWGLILLFFFTSLTIVSFSSLNIFITALKSLSAKSDVWPSPRLFPLVYELHSPVCLHALSYLLETPC